MPKIYLCLSKFGDLMNLMPIWYQDFKATGERQRVVVSPEFSSILRGVSYAEFIEYKGPTYEVQKAYDFANTLGGEVICTMTNGPREQIKNRTYLPSGSDSARATSYQKESWRVAGRLASWDQCWPLVFDRRNPKREEALLRKHDLIKRGKQKPLMLLALNSKSSPFPYADLLRELVTLKFGNDWRIMELPQAERIYDLLAIYERADLLIAVDSAPLHLAWACRKLPVFALTQDRPFLWHGSAWRPSHLWFCRYRDWPVRAVEMANLIAGGMSEKDFGPGKIVVWSEYNGRRATMAGDALPVYRGACGRDSGNTLKDDVRHPYLKDIIRMALQKAGKDDMRIMVTRPHVRQENTFDYAVPFYAYRLAEYPDGPQFQPVVDLFCATRKWWRDALPDIPDYVMDEPGHLWAQGLWALFKSKGATDATGCCTYSGGDK